MKITKAGCLTVLGVLAVAGCGGSAAPAATPEPAVTASTAATASPSASSAACAKLSASAIPLAAYDDLVIKEINLIVAIHGGKGSASRADIRAARSEVAAQIRAGCPRFAYLAKHHRKTRPAPAAQPSPAVSGPMGGVSARHYGPAPAGYPVPAVNGATWWVLVDGNHPGTQLTTLSGAGPYGSTCGEPVNNEQVCVG